MSTTCGFSLKTGRLNAKIKLTAAALRLNIAERTLYQYEGDKVKNKDPQIILGAIKLYNDESIGLCYLEENPVFKYLFGEDESLLDKLIKRLKLTIHTALDNFTANNQRPGYAY